MGRNNRWQHFRTRGKMPLFCFCQFFYLSLEEDLLAVGPGNCRIYLTLIDFSPSSIWKWCLPACLLERSFPLESRNMVWWSESLAAQLRILLSDIGYITPLHFVHHSLWLVDKQKPSVLSPGKSSAELSNMKCHIHESSLRSTLSVKTAQARPLPVSRNKPRSAA